MLRLTEIKLPLDHDATALSDAIRARLGLGEGDPIHHEVVRRGYDARRRSAISLIYTVDVTVPDEAGVLAAPGVDRRVGIAPDMSYHLVARAPESLRLRPVVIGAGPCGLMAALTLAQMGFRPIILDRGRVVRERTKDTWALWRRGVLTPESNVQFGEGGAGTFSDGKLWSGIKDPLHLGRRVLTEFVKAGAPDEILYVSKPHIGTFRLVTVVESLRAQIEALGGEYRFGSRVADLDIEATPDGVRRIAGVVLADGERIAADRVVLAVGHSARDSFAMLAERGVEMTQKPFSIGFRIEHPQSLIDRSRFGAAAGHPLLGAADYKLVHHASNGRSVYSFCMCPGGTVVAAASEPGHVVTNGMSQYSRAERNANAGIVVGITPEDYPGGPLAGIDFQRHWERQAFLAGGENLCRAGAARGRFPRRAPVDRARQRHPVLQAGRDAHRPHDLPAGLRDCRDPRGDPGLRPADPRLRAGGCGADGRRNAHLVAAAHRPRCRIAEPEHGGLVSGR